MTARAIYCAASLTALGGTILAAAENRFWKKSRVGDVGGFVVWAICLGLFFVFNFLAWKK